VSSSEGEVSESLELGQRSSEYQNRDSAMLRCQYYLRTTQFYNVSSQHEGIGSRKDKNWFLVREPGSQEDLLLSMVLKDTKSMLLLKTFVMSASQQYQLSISFHKTDS
jgi:hypothetical protein